MLFSASNDLRNIASRRPGSPFNLLYGFGEILDRPRLFGDLMREHGLVFIDLQRCLAARTGHLDLLLSHTDYTSLG